MEGKINQQFDFYYGSEAEQFYFYRISKILFTDKRFSSISVEAKVLYGLMLDRMSLSIKNGWIDEGNRVYIYFKLEDAMEYMGIGKDKGVKLFAELDSEKGCGLIQKKRQGLGKPARIYVMNFNTARNQSENGTPENRSLSQTSEKPKSELLENRSVDFGKTDSNDTEINNNKYSDMDSILSNLSSHVNRNDEMRERQNYRETICLNIEYDTLQQNYGEDMAECILEIMVDAVCSKKDYLVINCEKIPQSAVRCRFLKLKYFHIEYVLDALKKNTTKVRNIRSYLLTALYNALTIGPYYTAEVNHDLYGTD